MCVNRLLSRRASREDISGTTARACPHYWSLGAKSDRLTRRVYECHEVARKLVQGLLSTICWILWCHRSMQQLAQLGRVFIILNQFKEAISTIGNNSIEQNRLHPTCNAVGWNVSTALPFLIPTLMSVLQYAMLLSAVSQAMSLNLP